MTDAELKARLQALIDTFVQDELAAVVAYLRAQAEIAYDNSDAHHALWCAAEAKALTARSTPFTSVTLGKTQLVRFPSMESTTLFAIGL